MLCVPAMISVVPAAVPLVTHIPRLPLESLPENIACEPLTKKFDGDRKLAPCAAVSSKWAPALVPSVIQTPSPPPPPESSPLNSTFAPNLTSWPG